jgi:hypothetical protein
LPKGTVVPSSTTPTISTSTSTQTASQQATLSSPDGKYKTVVVVGSSQASQLQGKGWTLGSTGQTTTDINSALNYSSSTSAPTNSSSTPSANLTADQIKTAFAAYGYTPSDADLQYWALKPATDLTNLHDKLQARKDNDTQSAKDAATAKQETIKNNSGASLVFADPSKGGFVKFSTDPDGTGPLNTTTLFWVNPTTKKIIPIVSEQAFQTAFGKSFADSDIQTITVDYLGANGSLGTNAGYTLVPLDQGITGTSSDAVYNIPTEKIDTTTLGSKYGKAALSTDDLTKAMSTLDGFMDQIVQDQNFGVSSATINAIKSDPSQVAFYLNALAYGGYTLSNVASDLKRKQAVANGDTSLANVVVISPNQDQSTYYNTPTGYAAYSNTSIQPPAYLGDMNMGLLNYPIFQLPQAAFDVLVPPFDPNSAEGKAAMDKILTDSYDVIQNTLNADNEQQYATAQKQFTELQQTVKEKYGITLSNNAETAWNQLQSIQDSAANANISGSGVEQQAIDEQLRATRKTDQLNRTNKLKEDDANKAAYLHANATSAEIAALSAADREKYGFTPSADVANEFSIATLKAKYPTLSDEEIQAYHDSELDANGNYLSTAQKALNQSLLDNSKAKTSYQQTQAEKAASLAEEKAYAPYTGQTAFSQPNDATTGAGSSSSGSNNNVATGLNNNPINPVVTAPVVTSPASSTLNTGLNTSASAPTSNPKVSVKTVNGDTILVYKSSIPGLIAEGTLPKGTTG